MSKFVFMRFIVLTWLGLAFAAGVCHAGTSALTWSTLEQQFRAKAGDGKILAVYPFKNTGPNPVRISSLATSCACTTAESTKEIYAPGEEGQLRVEFDVGPQLGRQERTITVTTDEASTEPTILKIQVDIAELISIQPKLLFWKAGEKGEEKCVAVAFADPAQARLGELHFRNADFSARVIHDEKKGRYEIWVKPTDATRAAQTVIRGDATIEGKMLSFSIFAAVKS